MTLRLNGDTSGFVEIQAPGAAGDNSITLPADNASANNILKNSGTAGELEFTSNAIIDSDDRLIFGHDSGRLVSGHANQIQVIGSDQATARVSLQRTSNNGSGPGIHFAKARGDSFEIANDDDQIGIIAFNPSDGVDYAAQAVNIQAFVDGTIAENQVPGRLEFLTNSGANGSAPVRRLSILSGGTISLSNSPGIDFSGIQTNTGGMTSELLDGYEEGTWTPTSGDEIGDLTGAQGFYTKIGRQVFVTFQFTYASITAAANTAGGTAVVGGLPFSVVDHHSATSIGATGLIYENDVRLLCWATEETQNITINTGDPLGAGSATGTGSGFMRGSIMYHTAT